MRIKSWNPISNQSEIILNTGEFGTAFSKTSVIATNESQLFVGGNLSGIRLYILHLIFRIFWRNNN